VDFVSSKAYADDAPVIIRCAVPGGTPWKQPVPRADPADPLNMARLP
jgi:hypothetical protein